MPEGVPTPEEQREILERRLVAAVADGLRFGALADPDYGYRPEHLGDQAHAEGRAAELWDTAEEFGIDLPDVGEVGEKARSALREEYEQAARRREELLGKIGEVSLEMSVKTSRPGHVSEDRQRLPEVEEEAVRESGPVLDYLNDLEEDERWHAAMAREETSPASVALRAAGYPGWEVSRFARAALAVDGGADLYAAATDNSLDPNDLCTLLREREKARTADGGAAERDSAPKATLKHETGGSMERRSGRTAAENSPAASTLFGGGTRPEGLVRILVGWYGIDHSRPEEPNVYVERLEYPYLAPDYLADPNDPDVDDNHLRKITSDEELAAWAERECEWWDIRQL